MQDRTLARTTAAALAAAGLSFVLWAVSTGPVTRPAGAVRA